MSIRHTVIPSVNVYIFEGNKVLLGRRANTGWKDGWLCPPGGHVEKEETPTEACIREVKEELGVTVTPESLKFACVAVRNANTSEYVAYEFVIDNQLHGYQFINTEPNKCSELVWCDTGNMPRDVVEDFAVIMREGIVGNGHYLELGYKASAMA